MVGVEIDRTGEEVKLRAQSVRSVDGDAIKDTGAGLKIFVDTPEPLEAVRTRLSEKGKGLVSLVLMGEGGREVEIKLRERYKVTPQIRGAIEDGPRRGRNPRDMTFV